jgi:hypothetical protein
LCVSRLRRSEICLTSTPPSRVGLLPVGASAPVLLPVQFFKNHDETKKLIPLALAPFTELVANSPVLEGRADALRDSI